MTRIRFDDLMRCRLLLKPAAAVDALPYVDATRLREILQAEAATDTELLRNGYMKSNSRFRSLINRTKPMETRNRMIETLWMQFGPFMRVVYRREGTANLVDQHHVAADTIVRKDVDGLRKAVDADIRDGWT